MKSVYTEDIRKAPDSETVCYSADVSKIEILNARADGALTLEDIKKDTGACCEGRCRETSPRRR